MTYTNQGSFIMMLLPQMLEIVTAHHNDLLAEAAHTRLVRQAQQRPITSWWANSRARLVIVWQAIVQLWQRYTHQQPVNSCPPAACHEPLGCA
jgi:hypothetical protein